MFASALNIFKIPELRKKILFTLAMLCIYRIGFHVPVPGVNQEALAEATRHRGDSSTPFGRVADYLQLFTGGNLRQSSLFGLGIMPYISASIIFQLLVTVVPALEKLHKEGETGRKKIQEYTRYATVGICLIQSGFWLIYMRNSQFVHEDIVRNHWYMFFLMGIVAMTAGTIFLMWLGEQIDAYGIGNGISLIIMAGIIDRLPHAFYQAFRARDLDPGTILFLIAAFVFIVAGVVIMTQGQRRIPVQQAKMTRGRRVYGGQRQYLPFRVNHAGVMPVIFASTLLVFPGLIVGALVATPGIGATCQWLRDHVFQRGSSWIYTSLYIALIYFFSYFWTSLMFKPKDLSENLQDYGSFIPGIRPGEKTGAYLENVMTHITLAGSTFLAIVAITPQLLQQAMNINWQMAGFYGGTSLLIVVGVALDLVEKIESHLMMRHYEGFMRKGKIRGRR